MASQSNRRYLSLLGQEEGSVTPSLQQEARQSAKRQAKRRARRHRREIPVRSKWREGEYLPKEI